jgi:hypothetical protein
VHLVGFIIRIYHDARSSECQISAAAVTDWAVGWTWAVMISSQGRELVSKVLRSAVVPS